MLFRGSLSHADRKKHKELLCVLVSGLGLDVDAGQSRGQGDLDSLSTAGTEGINEEAVVKGDEDIVSFVINIDLIVGASHSGDGRDLEELLLQTQLNVRGNAARDLILGNQSRALQSRDQSLAVTDSGNAVIIENDAVKFDILSLDQAGEEDQVSNIEYDVAAGHIDANVLSLVILEELIELVDRLGGNDKGEGELGVIVVLIFDISADNALCKLKAIAGNGHELTLGHTEVTAVEDGALIVGGHCVHHLGEHALEYCLTNDKAVLGHKAGNGGIIGTRQSVHLVIGLTAGDAGLEIGAYGQGDKVSLHDTQGLHKLLSINDIDTGLLDLRLYGGAHTLFQVKGRDLAGLILAGINQNALNGGKGGFAGYGTHQGGDCVNDCLAIKDNFHWYWFLSFDTLPRLGAKERYKDR